MVLSIYLELEITLINVLASVHRVMLSLADNVRLDVTMTNYLVGMANNVCLHVLKINISMDKCAYYNVLIIHMHSKVNVLTISPLFRVKWLYIQLVWCLNVVV